MQPWNQTSVNGIIRRTSPPPVSHPHLNLSQTSTSRHLLVAPPLHHRPISIDAQASTRAPPRPRLTPVFPLLPFFLPSTTRWKSSPLFKVARPPFFPAPAARLSIPRLSLRLSPRQSSHPHLTPPLYLYTRHEHTLHTLVHLFML